MNKGHITKPASKIGAESDPDNTVPPLIAPIVSDDKDSEEEPEAVDTNISGENNAENKSQVRFAGLDAKIMRAMKKLSGTSYNPEPDKMI